MSLRPHRAYRVLRSVLVLVLLLLAHRSWAAGCTSSTFAITMPDATYSGSADALKPGAALDGTWSPQAGAKYFFDVSGCSAATIAKSTYATPHAVPLPGITYNDGKRDYPVFPTGVDGIGYVASVAEQDYSTWYALNAPRTQLYASAGSTYNWMGTYAKILLVVTGRLKSGTYIIPAQTIITSNVYATADGSGAALTTPGSITLNSTKVTVTASTCSLTTPVDQSVTLPAVGKGALETTGARAGSASFRIALSCDANMTVYATMTDASTPTNTGDTLSLTSGSSSTGVGVQVFRDGLSTPVSFGPDSTVLGNTNQWQIGSSTSATTYTIPFMATYVRTAGDIAPGSVQAKATITFSYQ